MKDFTSVKKGDIVLRMLAGTIPMKLEVFEITDKLIKAGHGGALMWDFDRVTGVEVDDYFTLPVSNLIWEH